MPRFMIRSTFFNLCFYTLTAVSCIVLLPTLLLPRNFFMAVVHGFVYKTAFLEKYVLGLRYEVRGLEHIPQDGAYIVAAKHESAYETFKLHILFKDPAIVLKKELLKIPLWGKYLSKSDVIAIDRSSPKIAIQSIQDGAKRVAAQGREIIIFPQGTRVSPDLDVSERPYKIGIVRIQEATGLPIIPLALNTGVFYPKGKWLKKSGCAVFEFLPAILPSADASATLKMIETVVEERSAALRDEGRASIPRRNSKLNLILLPLFCILYSAYWFYAAHLTQQAVANFIDELSHNPSITKAEISPPRLSGFPFKLKLDFAGKQHLESAEGTLTLTDLHAKGWPALGMPIHIEAGNIVISRPQWGQPLEFDHLDATIVHWNEVLDIKSAKLKRADFEGALSGDVDFKVLPYPDVNLELTLANHVGFIMELTQKKIIKEKPAMFAMAALTALQKDGIVTTTISRQENILYLGPIRIAELPRIREPIQQ